MDTSLTSQFSSESVINEIKQFVTSDGYRHHYRHWKPADSKVKGYVVALHGIQSHSGWYEHSSQKLVEAGYEVLFVDRRGSGLNEKERGHARHQIRLMNDQLHFLRWVRELRNQEAPAVPVALLGLSWGGKLAAALAAKAPELIDGLILLYPGIKTRVKATMWQNFQLSLARTFDVLYKRVPIPLEDPKLFTSDSSWQQFIRTDSKTLRDVTVAFLLASRELDGLADQGASQIRCPTLLMLSGKDQIIDNHATKLWYETLASQERSLFEYPDSAHTLEFEPARDQYINDLLNWLEKLRQVT